MTEPQGTVSATSGIDTSPLRKSVTVERSQEDAFRLFTAGVAGWWPYASHSIGGERTHACFIEPQAGGRIYERLDNGTEYEWGRVSAWEPPDGFIASWDPSPQRRIPTEIEVRFIALGPSTTRVELEHRGWDRIGERARTGRPSYDTGWDSVLGRYVAASNADAPT
jgi:hypothetical protein